MFQCDVDSLGKENVELKQRLHDETSEHEEISAKLSNQM